MNPDDEVELEEVFDTVALERFAGIYGKGRRRRVSETSEKASRAADRWTEAWASAKDSPLPDTRRGRKPKYGTRPAQLVDPRDAEDDRGGERRNNPFERAENARPSRHQEPVVNPTQRGPVLNKSGEGELNYEYALTYDDYDDQFAKREAKNDAHKAAKLEYEAAAVGAPALRLPDMDLTPPARLQAIADEVRSYAQRTTDRLRPKSAPVEIAKLCKFCDMPSPCDCEQDDPDDDDAEADWDSRPEDSYAAAADRQHVYDVPDDRNQWQVDYADDLAEDEAHQLALDEELDRKEAERIRRWERDLEPWLRWVETDPAHQYHAYRGAVPGAQHAMPAVVEVAREPHLKRAVWTAERLRDVNAALGIDVPPDAPFDGIVPDMPEGDLCVHCRMDPSLTKKHGLCRGCQSYKKNHRGELPPPSVLKKKRLRKDG